MRTREPSVGLLIVMPSTKGLTKRNAHVKNQIHALENGRRVAKKKRDTSQYTKGPSSKWKPPTGSGCHIPCQKALFKYTVKNFLQCIMVQRSSEFQSFPNSVTYLVKSRLRLRDHQNTCVFETFVTKVELYKVALQKTCSFTMKQQFRPQIVSRAAGLVAHFGSFGNQAHSSLNC